MKLGRGYAQSARPNPNQNRSDLLFMPKISSSFTHLTKSKILVIGNICAGKTTLVRQFCDLLHMTPAILDEFRQQYGDGSIAGDYLAYHHLLLDCANPHPRILEFSGAGPHKWAIRLALQASHLPCAVVFVDTPVKTCITRAQGKIFDVPYPPWGVSPVDIIPALQLELEEDRVKGFWTASSNFVFAPYQADSSLKEFVKLLDQALKQLEDSPRATIK